MMKAGLEWLHRLTREPKRLWQRYLINNPSFLVLFGLQLLRAALTINLTGNERKSIFANLR
jgi:N-acetylglucosaminyldiphosphoundecaprenol N-acetyl-beta-D-mannosaminyltransferase